MNLIKPKKDLLERGGWRLIWMAHTWRQVGMAVIASELERALSHVRLCYNTGWQTFHSPAGQTRAIKHMIEIAISNGVPIVVPLMDFSDFFNSVSHDVQEMTECVYGVAPNVTRAHMHIYRNQTGSSSTPSASFTPSSSARAAKGAWRQPQSVRWCCNHAKLS